MFAKHPRARGLQHRPGLRPQRQAALLQLHRQRPRKRACKHAKLNHIGLHEARHTFASYLIAAGANPKAISEVMGHTGIAITLDRYGHLLPGSIDEMTARLDTFLDSHDGKRESAEDGVKPRPGSRLEEPYAAERSASRSSSATTSPGFLRVPRRSAPAAWHPRFRR